MTLAKQGQEFVPGQVARSDAVGGIFGIVANDTDARPGWAGAQAARRGVCGLGWFGPERTTYPHRPTTPPARAPPPACVPLKHHTAWTVPARMEPSITVPLTRDELHLPHDG